MLFSAFRSTSRAFWFVDLPVLFLALPRAVEWDFAFSAALKAGPCRFKNSTTCTLSQSSRTHFLRLSELVTHRLFLRQELLFANRVGKRVFDAIQTRQSKDFKLVGRQSNQATAAWIRTFDKLKLAHVVREHLAVANLQSSPFHVSQIKSVDTRGKRGRILEIYAACAVGVQPLNHASDRASYDKA
jgi:hypothetical protein